MKNCVVCNDPIPEDWKVPDECCVCPKKRCWEVFLPIDLEKKYLHGKSRFEMLKDGE